MHFNICMYSISGIRILHSPAAAGLTAVVVKICVVVIFCVGGGRGRRLVLHVVVMYAVVDSELHM
jgi:hypothetical protein